MKQLSSIDAQMLYMETPLRPNHVGQIAVYDPSTAPRGRVTFKDILARVESRLSVSRTFRRRLVRVPFDLSEPYWIEDEHFDIELHAQHVRLPLPGDWRQFCILTARHFARPLDLTRPPWELTVIEGLDNIAGLPKGCFALLLKVHHAAIDGMSGLELVSAIHDLKPKGKPPKARFDWRPEPVPSPLALLSKSAWGTGRKGRNLISAILEAAPAMQRAKKQRSAKAPFVVPRLRFNKGASAHRVIESRLFPLSDFKRIRDAVEGATVNDVALAIVSGALRAYLVDKGELPKQSLVVGVPVSVWRDAANEEGGNQIVGTTALLHTNIEKPLDRLRAITASMVGTKAYLNAVGARKLAALSQAIPGLLQGLGQRAMAEVGGMLGKQLMLNLAVTNIPGPTQPLYFAGARLVRQLGAGPILPGVGMLHIVTSYCGEVSINVTADRIHMPDPQFYAECLQRSFDELLELALATSAAKPLKVAQAVATKAAPVKKVVRSKVSSPRKRSPVKA